MSWKRKVINEYKKKKNRYGSNTYKIHFKTPKLRSANVKIIRLNISIFVK